MKPRAWHLSYDISSPKRWRRVVKLAEASGDRVQKSLFLCALSREQLPVLYAQLAHIVKSPDRLLLRPICNTCRAREQWQGKGQHPERLESYWIV